MGSQIQLIFRDTFKDCPTVETLSFGVEYFLSAVRDWMNLCLLPPLAREPESSNLVKMLVAEGEQGNKAACIGFK
jgi:hypothetical protein